MVLIAKQSATVCRRKSLRFRGALKFGQRQLSYFCRTQSQRYSKKLNLQGYPSCRADCDDQPVNYTYSVFYIPYTVFHIFHISTRNRLYRTARTKSCCRFYCILRKVCCQSMHRFEASRTLFQTPQYTIEVSKTQNTITCIHSHIFYHALVTVAGFVRFKKATCTGAGSDNAKTRGYLYFEATPFTFFKTQTECPFWLLGCLGYTALSFRLADP